MLVDVIPYHPRFYVDLPRVLDVGSAWRGLERVLYDIVCRFNIPQNKALEFGVEYGYSTSALANVFSEVTGVDTFSGDRHSGYKVNHFPETKERLKAWPNIALAHNMYQTWITFDQGQYDLIHIDIEHNYSDTYQCGYWAVRHAPVVLFHDTQSFEQVKYAVRDLAHDTKRSFYNYEPCHGLGILVREP